MLVCENNRFVLTEECPAEPAANAACSVRQPYERWIQANNKAQAYMLARMSNVLKDENIGFDGYIGDWILRIYRIYRRYIGGYFYMNIDIS